MEEELVYIKMVKLNTHHKTPTLYMRDKLLQEYVGKKLLVKVYLMKKPSSKPS